MLNIKELRIGNYHLYHMIDNSDNRKEWDELCQIDPLDFEYLTNYPNDECYNPIILDENTLSKCGGVLIKRISENHWQINNYDIVLERGVFNFLLSGSNIIQLTYLHELQNLIFYITGSELTFILNRDN